MKLMKEMWNFTHINALKKVKFIFFFYNYCKSINVDSFILSCIVFTSNRCQNSWKFLSFCSIKAVTTIICLFLYHVLQRYIEKSKDKLKQASVFPTDIFYMENILSFIVIPYFFKIKHTSLRRRLVQF